MHHRNAPLTVVGRQPAVAQVIDSGRPISRATSEFRIARTTLSKWVGRYRELGEPGLQDRSSAPAIACSRAEHRVSQGAAQTRARERDGCVGAARDRRSRRGSSKPVLHRLWVTEGSTVLSSVGPSRRPYYRKFQRDTEELGRERAFRALLEER